MQCVWSFAMELQSKVRFYLEDIETTFGKVANLTIAGLVLLSSAIFIAETYRLPDAVRVPLDFLDQLILAIFTTEYLLRLWSAEYKLKYFFSLYALIDLIAILPFLFTAIDIRFIRIFRWFRILRLLRYVEGKTIFGYVSREDSAILVRILFTLFSIIFIYSGLIYQVEHPINPNAFATFLDAVYFAIATMTTVGYGDITPISQVGRLLAVMMILTGIGLIPWQVGDLIKQLVRTSNRGIATLCTNCGCTAHDVDAHFCKLCGKPIAKVGNTCEIPLQDNR
ncbi:MAG: ion transporter [Drouetiella hepatica Uher 2000/2452]|jgi:voltage-gated potassium channel|uniref:Ion transporter n=1 Tax=Drouetiella hepatica Uher 2000/2452 TaxID=904376 RepID=A0A951Q9A7_9CYAN|nr:ion transporter [Drouetiella hepatica Uher 2000/2452]